MIVAKWKRCNLAKHVQQNIAVNINDEIPLRLLIVYEKMNCSDVTSFVHFLQQFF